MTRDRLDEFGVPIDRRRVEPSPLFDAVPSPLPDVPAACRASHPKTSHDAARSVAGQHAIYRAILQALDESVEPLTDGDIASAVSIPGRVLHEATIRMRRVELVRGGFIVERDQLGRTPYGRAAIRWGRTFLSFTGEADQVRAMRDTTQPEETDAP